MFIREFEDNIQNRIVEELEKHDSTTEIGADMLSLIAISARQTISKGKPNKFIKELASHLNISVGNWDTFSERILSELYPLNTAFWRQHDKYNTERIEKSVWLKNQHLCGA